MRTRRRGWWVLPGQTLILAVVLVVAAPEMANGCSVARFPYLSEAVASADRVLVVRIVDLSGDRTTRADTSGASSGSSAAAAPPVMRVAAPMTTACGDRLQARIGDRVLIAFGVTARRRCSRSA